MVSIIKNQLLKHLSRYVSGKSHSYTNENVPYKVNANHMKGITCLCYENRRHVSLHRIGHKEHDFKTE